jgi:hypothetical protein
MAGLIMFIKANWKWMAIVACLAWVANAVYQSGHRAGAAEVQARFDAYKLEVQATQQEAVKTEQVQQATASTKYEEAKVKRDTVTRTVIKEIVREVEKPIYRECVVPDDGVRLLNAARSGSEASPPSEPDAALSIDSTAAPTPDDGGPSDR